MTHHPVKVLEDGTRVYSNYTRRTPVPDHLRKYKKRKPDDPRALLYQGNWYLPLELVPLADRIRPETRPDTDAYDHMSKARKCKCNVCRRPESKRWKLQWKREQRAQMRTGSVLS